MIRVFFLRRNGFRLHDSSTGFEKAKEVKHEKPAETDGVGIAKDEEDNEHFANLEEQLVRIDPVCLCEVEEK